MSLCTRDLTVRPCQRAGADEQQESHDIIGHEDCTRRACACAWLEDVGVRCPAIASRFGMTSLAGVGTAASAATTERTSEPLCKQSKGPDFEVSYPRFQTQFGLARSEDGSMA